MTADNNYVAARPGTALGQPASMFKPAQAFFAGVGAGAFVDMPGPPVGHVRCYDSVSVVGAVAADAISLLTIAVNPGALVAALQTGAVTISVSFRVPTLAFGETLRVTNGGANVANVAATYLDVPATWLTTARIALTDAVADVIPAAPAGFVRRFLQFGELTTHQGRTMAPKFMAFNSDTVGHALEFVSAGTPLARHLVTASGAQFPMREPTFQWPVTTVALRAHVLEAIVTTPVNLFCTYETLPL